MAHNPEMCESIPVQATRQMYPLKFPQPDKTDLLLARVERLIELLEEPSSIILTGQAAVNEYKKLTS